MKKDRKTVVLIVLCSLFVVAAVLYMFKDKLFVRKETVTVSENREMPAADAVTNEITNGLVVEQKFINRTDPIKELAVVFTKLYVLDDVDITIELLDGNKSLLKKTVNVLQIEDQHRFFVEASQPIEGVLGKELTLRIYPETASDTGLALMMQETGKETILFGKMKVKGTICFSLTGE
ncbi:MAG: hypothetical protein IJF87_07675 [Erysipelotrichaceae bacterium]|nr:hypothetical protein [Erysipelotrichaceae bacterium]